MNQNLKKFLRTEDGAVTVDWVVLTAAIIGIGILVVGPIVIGSNSMADKVGGTFTKATVSLSSGLVAN